MHNMHSLDAYTYPTVQYIDIIIHHTHIIVHKQIQTQTHIDTQATHTFT